MIICSNCHTYILRYVTCLTDLDGVVNVCVAHGGHQVVASLANLTGRGQHVLSGLCETGQSYDSVTTLLHGVSLYHVTESCHQVWLSSPTSLPQTYTASNCLVYLDYESLS